MGTMDLNGVDSGLNGALCSVGEAFDEIFNLIYRDFLGSWVALVPGDGAGSPEVVWPATVLGERNFGPVMRVPWTESAGFAAGVGKLNTNFLTLRVDEIDNALQGCDLAVLPKPTVLGRNSPIRGNGGSLDDGKRSAPKSKGAQMNKVEVGEVAVVCRVHAHRAHNKPVLEFEGPDLERGEDCWNFGIARQRCAGRRILGRSVEWHARSGRAEGELFDRHDGV